METRNERDRGIIDERREVIPPVEPRERSSRVVDAVDTRPMAGPPVGPRLRWGGVTSGFVMALGTVLLLTALGLAIGITAIGDPRAATDDTAARLGISAGVWTAITLLIAYFLGGMVSTKVTDRPDRGGALMHGVIVWTVVSVFLLWLVGQGVSLGLSSFFGALSGLTRTAATAVTETARGDGNLAQRLGLTDPSRVADQLNNPEIAALFASATGMSREEAQSALAQLRSRVEAAGDNPNQVATEVRNFLAQYDDRVRQQALNTAAAVQEGATVSSWVTFGVLVLTLIASILGALAGIPSLRAWRSRWAHAGAA